MCVGLAIQLEVEHDSAEYQDPSSFSAIAMNIFDKWLGATEGLNDKERLDQLYEIFEHKLNQPEIGNWLKQFAVDPRNKFQGKVLRV